MRVALIAPPWLPVPAPAYGGTEAVIDVLARGLTQRGHEVLLFAHADSRCPVTRACVLGPDVELVVGDGTTELSHALGAYHIATREGVDIVHDHTFAGAILAARSGLPTVITVHRRYQTHVESVYAESARAASLVSVSDAHARSTELPTQTVHHGVDFDRLSYGDGSGGYAMFLGRMSSEKGVHLAIDTANLARLPLVIAAKMRDASERLYFEQCVRPRLDSRVTFVGEVTTMQKITYLRDAAVLINPISWPEPFGLVMLEAAACGTPVVACPLGAAPEIVLPGRTGYLGAGVEQLAALIPRARLLDRRACRDEAFSRFSADRMVERYLSLYARQLATSSTRSAHRA